MQSVSCERKRKFGCFFLQKLWRETVLHIYCGNSLRDFQQEEMQTGAIRIVDAARHQQCCKVLAAFIGGYLVHQYLPVAISILALHGDNFGWHVSMLSSLEELLIAGPEIFRKIQIGFVGIVDAGRHQQWSNICAAFIVSFISLLPLPNSF